MYNEMNEQYISILPKFNDVSSRSNPQQNAQPVLSDATHGYSAHNTDVYGMLVGGTPPYDPVSDQSGVSVGDAPPTFPWQMCLGC